jgi:hypothetical protein
MGGKKINFLFSNTVLCEQLEAMQISNELLREDNASIQKKLDKMQEVLSRLYSHSFSLSFIFPLTHFLSLIFPITHFPSSYFSYYTLTLNR